jgi:hypothetical protein
MIYHPGGIVIPGCAGDWVLRGRGRKKISQPLGYVALHQGDWTRAERLAKESLTLLRGLGDMRGIPDCLGVLAGAAGARGSAVWCHRSTAQGHRKPIRTERAR